MKLLLLLLTLFSLSFSAIAKSPYPPYLYSKINSLENGGERLKKYQLDLADSSTYASGASVTLSDLVFPADTLITQVYIYTDEVAVSSSNTISLGCETTTDLLGATDFSDDTIHDVINGAVTGPTGAVHSSDGCTVVATIGAGAGGISDGRIVLFIKYLNPEETRF